jgi:BioD-like phosphotransacetylase family protein
VPHRSILSSPTVDSIRDELKAQILNGTEIHNLVEHVIIGAMSPQNAVGYFKPGVLVITPGDREDLVMAAACTNGKPEESVTGIVLTGGFRPSDTIMQVIAKLPFPVLLARENSYEVAFKVHNMIVKTRPADTEKIAVIRDIIAAHVDVNRILGAL